MGDADGHFGLRVPILAINRRPNHNGCAEWWLSKTKILSAVCGRSMVSRVSDRERRVFRGRRHDLVREPDAGDLHVRIDER